MSTVDFSQSEAGSPTREVTIGELLKPAEGSKVEFWCHRMSQQGVAGSGIRGWFRSGLFWSEDNADHYAAGEVTGWRRLPDEPAPRTLSAPD